MLGCGERQQQQRAEEGGGCEHQCSLVPRLRKLIWNLNLKIHSLGTAEMGLLQLTVFHAFMRVGVKHLPLWYNCTQGGRKAKGKSALSALGLVVNVIIAESLREALGVF